MRDRVIEAIASVAQGSPGAEDTATSAHQRFIGFLSRLSADSAVPRYCHGDAK